MAINMEAHGRRGDEFQVQGLGFGRGEGRPYIDNQHGGTWMVWR